MMKVQLIIFSCSERNQGHSDPYRTFGVIGSALKFVQIIFIKICPVNLNRVRESLSECIVRRRREKIIIYKQKNLEGA